MRSEGQCAIAAAPSVCLEHPIGKHFRDIARSFRDRPAIITADGSLSYTELDVASDQIAAALLGQGLLPGDRILLQVGNTSESVMTWYGLLKAGLIPVCSLPSHSSYETRSVVRYASPRALIVQADIPGRDLLGLATETMRDHGCVDRVLVLRGGRDYHSRNVLALEDLRDGMDPERSRELVEEVEGTLSGDDLAVLQLSGGTTGVPKLIPRQHGEYWYNAMLRVDRWGLDHSERIGYSLPIFHNAGVQTALHLAHGVGAALVLSDSDPNNYLPLFHEVPITQLLLPVDYARTILDHHPVFESLLGRLTRLILVLGPVDQALFDAVEGAGATLLQDFGMSEGLCMTHLPSDSPAIRRGTVGFPLSEEDEVRIESPDGDVLAGEGITGELLVRGPYTISAYYNPDAGTVESFTSDGFFRTGDLVSVCHYEGREYYRVVGRIKDIISRGGEKIDPLEVEKLLLRCPDVSDVAVVGIRDPRLGERACAFVVPSRRKVGLKRIQRFLEENGLAKYKWPEHVVCVDSIPRTSIGKIRKDVLRESLNA